MFPKFRTLAFILKETSRNEADKTLMVFSRDFGKLEIRARGIRKMESKLKGAVPIFSLAEIEFVHGGKTNTLTDSLLVCDFRKARKSLAKMNILCAAGDVLDKSIKGPEKDENIWQLIYQFFSKIETAEKKEETLSIYRYFLRQLSSLFGYGTDHLVI